MTEADLKRLAANHSSQAWRRELKVGDKVDVNIDADDKKKLRGWV